MLADSAASNGEPIYHLAESSAKPMRSRGFNLVKIKPIKSTNISNYELPIIKKPALHKLL
jgi:hypothetical protein